MADRRIRKRGSANPPRGVPRPDGGDLPARAAMAESSHMDGLPAELLMEILSWLTWRQQLGVRSVSRRWQATVDACLARQQELYVCIKDHCQLDKLISLLHKMPALRGLVMRQEGFLGCIERHSARKDLDIGPPLDTAQVEMMCSSCPRLEEIHLSCVLKEDAVQMLLSRLTGIKVLHLPFFKIKCDMLSLLPAGLQSLSLRSSEDKPQPAVFRPLACCSQLCELQLGQVFLEDLETALAACPRLERLSLVVIFAADSDWTSMLTLCPQLRELEVCDSDIDFFAALGACPHLERLIFNKCAVDFEPLDRLSISQPYMSLTYLYLSFINDDMDDDIFWDLTRLLPGLTHLAFYTRNRLLTEEGLARGLQHFIRLQVLELGCGVSLSATGPMLDSLSNLPLEALYCKSTCSQDTAAAHCIVALLRHCPNLVVLGLPDCEPTCLQSFAHELGNDSLEQRVALILHSDVPSGAVRLPGEIMLLKDGPGIWEVLTRWFPWKVCGDCMISLDVPF